MNIEELKIVITAKSDNLKMELNKVTKQFSEIENETKKVSKSVNTALNNVKTDNLKSEINTAKKQFDDLGAIAKKTADSVNKAINQKTLGKADINVANTNSKIDSIQVITDKAASKIKKSTESINNSFNGLNNSTKKVTDNIGKSLNNVKTKVDKSTNDMAVAFSRLKTTLIALGIGKVLKDSFNIARTFEASVQQVNRLFGAYSSAMDAWINKNAKTFGLAKAQAMQYTATYGNLLSGFLGSQSEMASKTQELLQATSIVAASTGRTIEDVSRRITSGLLGNTEAIILSVA